MIPTDPLLPRTIHRIDDDAAILCYEKALPERSGYSVLSAPAAFYE
jgi:hypothetical protein